MTNMNVLSEAELARRKLSILRQSLRRAAGKAPVVENLLPAISGDDIAKLQSSRQGQACKVILEDVQVPDGAQPGDTIIALLKDDFVVSAWEELPLPVPNPHEMILPGTETATPGIFRLKYKVLYASNSTESDPSEFFIDTVAPNHGRPGNKPTPPVEVVDGLITRDILDLLGDITMIIDPPDDVRNGDKYTLYYGKSIPAIPVGVFNVDENSSSPIEIKVPKAMIEIGEGDFICYCKFEDRVGNVGPESMPLNLRVELTPVPSGLQPPEVPESDDGVVDLNDAYPDVAVVIPTFDNGLPIDQVRVTFNGKVQPPQPTDGTAQVIVDVPFADVAEGGDGPKDVTVTYAIVRDGKDFPEPVGKTFNVNLTIPGPANPEPDPDLGNPNLNELVLKGSTGDNTLVEDDVGNEIDIDLTIYTGFKDGDIVNLKWEGKVVPPPGGRYAVDGTEDPAFKIPFKLPSAIFEATSNGKKIARYVITNPTDNGENENPSPPTEVDVYIYPVTLPVPVIQHLYTNPIGREYLDCSSLRDIPVVGKAAIIRVEGGGSLEPEMTLEFKWSGTKFPVGSDPVDDYLFEKTLQGTEHINGFEVYLPFNIALKTIADGEGAIVYTATIDGRTHSSVEHKVRVVVIDADQNFCSGTRAE